MNRGSTARLNKALMKGSPLTLRQADQPSDVTALYETRSRTNRTVHGPAVAAAIRAGKADIVIDGAYIAGGINLAGMLKPNLSLSITNCLISSEIILDKGNFADVDLHGTVLDNGISATSLRCRSLNLRNTVSEGGVFLRYSQIDGPLELHDSILRAKDLEALDIRGATVSKSVRLDRMQAHGAVLASGITVHGAFVCAGARLLGVRWREGTHDRYGESRPQLESSCVAMVMDRAEIRGGLALRNELAGMPFVSIGMVRVMNSNVDSINCDGGSFINHKAFSLIIEQCKITGSLSFRNNASSVGTIRIFATSIGDALDMSTAKISATDSFALTAERTQVIGPVHLRNGFSSRGAVHFKRSSLESVVDVSNARFQCADEDTRQGNHGGQRASDIALSFEDSIIHGTVFAKGAFSAEGRVTFRLAEIRGSLILAGNEEANIKLSNIGRHALDAFGLRVSNALVIKHVTVMGLLDLRNARCSVLQDEVASWPEARISGLGFLARLTRKPRFIAQGAFIDRFSYDFLMSPDYRWRSRRQLLRKSLNRNTGQPYLQLAALYSREGHTRVAKRVHIARLNATTPLGSPLRWLAQPLVGYGYAPLRGLVVLILAATLGGVYFTGAAKENAMKPTRPPATRVVSSSCNADIYPCFNAYVFSVDSLLPIIGLKQRDYWTPDFSKSPRVAAVAWFLNALGWIVGLLVVAGFTNLLRKE